MADEKFSRFQILEDIGQGGIAKVFRAYDPQGQREVAVKALPLEFQNDLGVRARFEWERQLVIALDHEAIVPVYESGEVEGQPYIVMPYMPNGSLAARLLHGPLAPEEAAAILERIGSALDYIHAKGVLHRDIKPSNILFDKEGKAYLADFGIAWQESSIWEPNRAISGTPVYMSPEQVLREEIDQRSDIYSLGVIAFEILSGHPPFNGDSPMAVALKQVYDPLPRLQTVQGKAHSSLETVVLRALAKDARERYPTATAFAQAFRSALNPDQKPPLRRARSKRKIETEKAISGTGPSPTPPLPTASPPLNAIPHLPPLTEINPRSVPPRGPAPWTGWKVQHILAMLLVTWLGLFFASVVAAAAWSQGMASKADFEIIYNDTGVAVMNASGGPLDLTTLTFQRVSDSGTVTASFPALQWMRSGLGPVNALQAGACFQLLLPDLGSQPLIPGKAPAKPDACQVSQGWLLAQDPDWRFWLVQDQSQAFQVLSGERVIQTCQISEGSCQFSLPKSE